MTGPGIDAFFTKKIDGRQGIDQRHAVVLNGRPHFLPVGNKRGLWRRRQNPGFPINCTGREWPALCDPRLQPAIKDRCAVEADPAQHPPDPCSPGRHEAVIEHNTRIITDAQPAHRLAESLRRRYSEFNGTVRVAKLALQVGKAGTWNVALLILRMTALVVKTATLFHDSDDTAVEHHEIRIVKMLLKPLCRDQIIHPGLPAHCAVVSRYSSLYVAVTPSKNLCFGMAGILFQSLYCRAIQS